MPERESRLAYSEAHCLTSRLHWTGWQLERVDGSAILWPDSSNILPHKSTAKLQPAMDVERHWVGWIWGQIATLYCSHLYKITGNLYPYLSSRTCSISQLFLFLDRSYSISFPDFFIQIHAWVCPAEFCHVWVSLYKHGYLHEHIHMDFLSTCMYICDNVIWFSWHIISAVCLASSVLAALVNPKSQSPLPWRT